MTATGGWTRYFSCVELVTKGELILADGRDQSFEEGLYAWR